MIRTKSTTSSSWLWIISLLGLLLIGLLFAKKVTQLSFPGLDITPKTVIIEPQCPTPEQKEVIRRNMNLYGAGYSQGYDNSIYMGNLISMAKTLGYPDP
ncbi:MAG: hypothetical protein GY803_26360, partial [Chloroflexi bacterium]|nr:hypothetical protein [Chloroflexota bacterium]